MRRQKEPPGLAKARRRVAKMQVHDLMEWADLVISGMGRGLTDYRDKETVESLLELRDIGLPALTAVLDELLLRYEAANS